MRPDQVDDSVLDRMSEVLKMCAAFDARTIAPEDLLAWGMAIGDLPHGDVMEAVMGFYTSEEATRRRIIPADVVKRVKAVQRERLSHTVLPAPPPEMTDAPGRYKAELDAMIAAVTTGAQGRGLARLGHPNRRRELNRDYAARRALQAPAAQPPLALRAAQEDADAPGAPSGTRRLAPVSPARPAAAERAEAEAQRYLAARLADPATQEYLERAHAELEAEDGDYDAVDVTVRAAALMRAAEPKVS